MIKLAKKKLKKLKIEGGGIKDLNFLPNKYDRTFYQNFLPKMCTV